MLVSSTSMAQVLEGARATISSSPPLGGSSTSAQPNGNASPPRSPSLTNGGSGGQMGKTRIHVPSSTSSSASSLDALLPLQTTPTTPESKRLPQTTSSAAPALLSPVIESHSPSSTTGKSDEYFPSGHRARANGVRGGRNDVARSREPQPPPIPLSFTTSSTAATNAQDQRESLGAKPNGYVRDREDLGWNLAGGGSPTVTTMGNSNATNGWQQSMTKQQRKAASAAAAASVNVGASLSTSKGAAAAEGARKGGASSSSSASSSTWVPIPNTTTMGGVPAGAKTKNTTMDLGMPTTARTTSGGSGTGGAGKAMPVNEAERKGG